jgi:hypothetical protein
LILDLAAFFYDYLNVLSVDFDTLNGGGASPVDG